MVKATTNLLIGFDSAWGERALGSLSAALLAHDERLKFLLNPTSVTWDEAFTIIKDLKNKTQADTVTVFVDQPVTIKNQTGQRPVEKIISSIISKLGGGVQPAYLDHHLHSETSKLQQFIRQCQQHFKCEIVETYPALSNAACGWLVSDEVTDKTKLPKYNPSRRTFAIAHWQCLCDNLADELLSLELHEPLRIVRELKALQSPNKIQQDQLDSLICLFNAICHCKLANSMLVGHPESGQISIPYSETLARDLRVRCETLGLDPDLYVQIPGDKGLNLKTQSEQPQDTQSEIAPEDFREYYRELNNRELSNIQAFDKAILTLASSGLALTAAFHENFITADSPVFFAWVKGTWLFFVASIISVIISFLSANKAIEYAKEHIENLAAGGPGKDLDRSLNRWTSITSAANFTSAILFILAVICFTVYVWVNS